MGKLKLPPFAKVGHRKYKIEGWTATQAQSVQRYGECSSVEAAIRVDTTIDITKARDTLLHEIMHAIYYEWGMSDEDKEERVVGTMATALTQVMADSPELRNWLAKAWAK